MTNENETNEGTKYIVGSAEFFFKRMTTVHVKTLNDRFYNGIIVEIIGSDFLILNDKILGEIPIYFSEITEIEPFTPRSVM